MGPLILLACLLLVGHPLGADEPSQDSPTCPPLTRIRLYPQTGHAKQMVGGRFTGSNEGRTTEFQTLAQIKSEPPDGQWTEITLEMPVRFRCLKYESPLGGWGAVAEVEFFSGDRKLQGEVFGTTGSKDGGHDFHRAMDGDTATGFEGAEPHGQYVGIDLGPGVQAAPVTFLPEPGSYEAAQTVAMRTSTPGATIRFTRNGGVPNRESGEVYRAPIRVEKGTVLAAIASTEQSAPSRLAVVAYRIGQPARGDKVVRTFHIGNSLTDTVDGWLEPVAQSAGQSLDFHRFTIPGAPTDWLWDHPGGGFGDSRYAEAFDALAPIDHLFTQPFAGHDRSIENEADFSGRFFDLCRKDSPGVQMWLYAQWPGRRFDDNWSRGKGSAGKLGLEPAKTWQKGAANQLAYVEAVRDRLDASHEGKLVRIVPAGTALAQLKTRIDEGEVPGMTDFFAETFADDLHLNAKGRYLVALVHYACIFGESPEGKVSALTTGLTPEQAKVFQRVAWDAVKGYRWSGIKGR
jgi:Chitobiase/beta-hexosaminidase C-terminal domain